MSNEDQTSTDQNGPIVDMNQLNEKQFYDIYNLSSDVLLFTKQYEPDAFHYSHQPAEVIFMFSDVTIDRHSMKETVLPGVMSVYKDTGFASLSQLEHHAELDWLTISTAEKPITISRLSSLMFEGNVMCIFPKLKAILSVNVSDLPIRQPDESALEISVRGARDCFTESLATNVALLRRRVRSQVLACEIYSLGTITDTKVALMYIKDVANEDLIEEARKRLKGIQVEQLVTSGELETLISDQSYYYFPTVDYTSRPDFVVQSMLEGRFALILDNNPVGMIAPANLFQMLKSPEDSYFPVLASNIGRVFRLVSLIASIFLPSFFIALITFHPDQLPYAMLATVSVSRKGLPMEAGIEMFLIMTFMELFREASVRLPSNLGQTITVVGGLIIGEASIRAGLVSPIVVVVSAITIIATATLVHQSLTSIVVFVRLLSFFLGASFGIFGLITSFTFFLLYLSKVHSFGVPILAPLAPLNIRSALPALFEVPLKWMKRRPNYLHPKKPEKED